MNPTTILAKNTIRSLNFHQGKKKDTRFSLLGTFEETK